jgi:DNA polymerase elongation subunit (family B)
MDKIAILGEIKGFLEGYNKDLKYLVNVETDPTNNIAECVVHEPGRNPEIVKVAYEPFMYMKDLAKLNYALYPDKSENLHESKKIKYGITVTKLNTGNQKRLVDGYCYKITSSKSYNAIINYLRDGGIDPYEKLEDEYGNIVRDKKGDIVYRYRDCFYSPRTTEQFFISTRSRLFKGFEEYKNVHKLTFDIETTGLRYQISRVFAIGVRDNRGFETILEVEKLNDDESEIKLIQDFFNLIDKIQPAVISGYNSEMFDFEYILGRAKILKMDLSEIPTSLKPTIQLKRRGNVSVKYGNTADKYRYSAPCIL